MMGDPVKGFLPGLVPAPVLRILRSATVLAALVLAFRGLSALVPPPGGHGEEQRLEIQEGDLLYVFPRADAFSAGGEDGAFPYYRAFLEGPVKREGSAHRERLGICFVTTEVVDGARGWAGEVPVLVGLSAEGEILGVKVLPGANRETPGFIDPLYEPSFDEQYRGLQAVDPIRAGADVDGVTGATVSVEAVNDGIRRASRKAAREVLGLEAEGAGGGGSGFPPAQPGPYLLLALAALAVAGYVVRPGFRYRIAVLALSAALLGIWQGAYLTGSDLARLFTGNAPPGSAGTVFWITAGTALALAILAGKLWCGWLCPFGGASELLYRVVPFRLDISERWDRRFRRMRYLFLFGLPALAVATSDPGVTRFEPLASAFHPRSWTVASAFLLGWVVLGSAVVERFYCKFLCPVGALMDWLVGNRLFGRKEGRVCGGCFRGETGCRYLAERGADFAARRDRLQGDCLC